VEPPQEQKEENTSGAAKEHNGRQANEFRVLLLLTHHARVLNENVVQLVGA